ncbi:nucleolar protein [Moniliophthora roreri MCA 2997]|uniref:Nucleolar protein n=1 Tax=Moniliophthora roreri (strain MCA 2997) TaxID=1381753 RepID=V2XE25_MONRO|nr:nucleolar protein [Moniliophthora roreri MCA 2997]
MSTDTQGTTKSKGKKREKHEESSTNTALEANLSKKSKKGKEKATEIVEPQEESLSKKAKERSQRDSSSSSETAEIPASEKSTKKKKKSSSENKPEEGVEGMIEAKDSEKRMKRRKRKREEEQDAEQEGERQEHEEPPKKKKSKNKTGFPDPEVDLTLSDQARKALSYAFTQFRRPKKWKFQKARQNWLVRNFWSDKNIPETQIPLVLKYLANVQGGVRENLIKSCHDILNASIPPVPEKPSQAQNDAALATQPLTTEGDKPADSLRRQRATELLAVLQSS